MEDYDLLINIQKKMPYLSKGQKRIANFLIEHLDKAVYLTASKLGEISGVSESTVVRFAIEMGFDGYPKLQKAIEELVRNKLTAVQRIEVTSDRIERDKNILKSVLKADSERICMTLNEIDENTFEEAVNKILSARKIYVVGGRSSASLSNFLSFYLNLMVDNVIGVNSSNVTEVFEQIYRIEETDVFIGISFPRYSQKTIKAMEYAFNKNAFTIAITDSLFSPLAKFAKNCLPAHSDMISFVDSLVAPLSVINALLVSVSVNKKDDIIKNLANLEGLWNEYQVYTSNKSKKYIYGNTD